MPDTDRSGKIIDGEIADVPACVALVPLTPHGAVVAATGWHAAGSNVRHPTDRDRRAGAADPQPAAGVLRRRADGLWPATRRNAAASRGGRGRSSEKKSALRRIRRRAATRLQSRRRHGRLRGCSVRDDRAARIRRLRRLQAPVTLEVAAGAWAGAGSMCGSAAGASACACLALRRKPGQLPPAPPRRRAARARRRRTGNPPAPAASAGNRSRCRTSANSTNSAAAAPNTISDSRWSVRYFAPGRAPLMTSNSSSRMPSASSMSLSVTGHSAPDINVSLTTGSVKDTPGIRKTMML